MSNLYTKQGIDFDTWFSRSGGNQNFNIFSDSGMDIGQAYASGSGGPAVGWYTPGGEDLNAKLGSFAFGIYRPVSGAWAYGTSYKTKFPEHVSYWRSWLGKWSSNKKLARQISNITNDALYNAPPGAIRGSYQLGADNNVSQLIFCYNPVHTTPLNFSWRWGNQQTTIWDNSTYDSVDYWSDPKSYREDLEKMTMQCAYIEIDPWLKGIVVGSPSELWTTDYTITQPVYVTLSSDGYGEVHYNAMFGILRMGLYTTYKASDTGWNWTDNKGTVWTYHP